MPQLYPHIRYDPFAEFTPLWQIAATSTVLAVPTSLGVSTLAEFIALAKKSNPPLTVGSPGQGSGAHFYTELLAQSQGAPLTHVAYRGTAPAQVAVLAKEVDSTFDNPSSVPKIKAGQLRALAVTSAQRWHELPDVPTIAEAGYPGFDISFWVGALAPAGTPAPVVKTLSDLIATAVQDPEVKAKLMQQGNIRMLAPKQFETQIDTETKQYADIIRKANITLD